MDLDIDLSNGLVTFRQLLMNVHLRNASDQRDYIYGILGLVDKEIQSYIKIRYDTEPSSVFVDALSVACLGRYGSEGWCLLMEYFANTPKNSRNLPSWCPEFNHHVSDTFGGCYFKRGKISQELTHKTWKEHGFVFVNQVSGILSIDGACVDRVELASKIAPVPGQLREFILHASNGDEVEDNAWEIYCGEKQLIWLDHMRSLFLDPIVLERWLLQFFFGYLKTPPADLREEFSQILLFSDKIQLSGARSWREATHLLPFRLGINVGKMGIKIFRPVLSNRGRYFFITKGKRIGFAPVPVYPGCQVCIFPGGRTVHVLFPDGTRHVTVAYMEEEANLLFRDFRNNWKSRKITFHME